MATRNVFVPGLTDLQRGELETTRSARSCRFHPLLDHATLVEPEEYVFGDLLAAAREELAAFPGSVDAVVAHWDFPTSVLVPILAEEHGLPSPSLRSVLMCEHKYWSRLAQSASVPECVPRFASFDPFDDEALEHVDLELPFWIKPVKSHSSQLGFEVHDGEQLADAVREIRAGIGGLGHAFDEALGRVELPPELEGAGGTTCIAEEIVTGTQAAPEGTMFRGELDVHGVVDMHKDRAGHSFERLDYPASSVPEEVQERMADVSERYLRHIGFDDGCFNAEFMWDEDRQRLWLVEVNTRISQSHSDLFAKVDGMSNHEVAIDVALGARPSLSRRRGRFAVASKCMVSHPEDGVVRRVPSDEEIARLDDRFPETLVDLHVEPGDRLADTSHAHDSYRYGLATLYLGADDHEQLRARHRACREALHFEIEPVHDVPTAAPGPMSA